MQQFAANDNVVADSGSDYAKARHLWFMTQYDYFVSFCIEQYIGDQGEEAPNFGVILNEWLQENCRDYFAISFEKQVGKLFMLIYFVNAQEAMHFKLVWVGF